MHTASLSTSTVAREWSQALCKKIVTTPLQENCHDPSAKELSQPHSLYMGDHQLQAKPNTGFKQHGCLTKRSGLGPWIPSYGKKPKSVMTA